MKKIQALFVLSLIFLGLNSFNDEQIKIQIIQPIEKLVYRPGDTIWIEADVRSNAQLHNINLTVTNLDDKIVLYSKNIHSHANAIHIKEFFINPLLEKKGLSLNIKTTDHDGKTTASQVVNFSTAARKKKSK